jgi:hypothetical protein
MPLPGIDVTIVHSVGILAGIVGMGSPVMLKSAERKKKMKNI